MRVSTNEEFTSQLSMVTVLTDANNSATIVHFASWKSRRIFRSPLAAKFYPYLVVIIISWP